MRAVQRATFSRRWRTQQRTGGKRQRSGRITRLGESAPIFLTSNQRRCPIPYASKRQQAWAHTPAGTKALGGPKKVKEWDKASKGMKLPYRKHPKTLAQKLAKDRGPGN